MASDRQPGDQANDQPTGRERIYGAVVLLALALHLASKVQSGIAGEMLWGCHVASAALGIGLLLGRWPLAAVGFVFHLGMGAPAYLLDLGFGAVTNWTSVCTHGASLGLGALVAQRRGLPPAAVWQAWVGYALLLPLSLFLTDPALNVNVVQRPWLPLGPLFSNQTIYLSFNLLSAALCLWLARVAFVRAFSARRSARMTEKAVPATRGFTLIELFVVVAIMAIIAAVLVPTLLSRVSPARGRSDTAMNERAAERGELGGKDALATSAVALSVAEANVTVSTTLAHVLVGLEVRTRYLAHVSGTFLLRRPPGLLASDVAAFTVLFPKGATHARDVALDISDMAGRPLVGANLGETTYARAGVRWQGTLGEAPLRATLSYTVQGDTTLVLALPTHGRAEHLLLAIEAPGLEREWLSPDGVPPTALAPGRAVWDLKNAIVDRDFVVDLPPAQAPVARVILLCQLVGLGVLLFGAGYWYLAELARPGSLRSFRWGHFLLLALTYSTFFIVFAVLAFESSGPPWPLLALSLAVSHPLLLLHTSRSAGNGGWRFALGRVWPLALVTQGVVVLGVYGESARPVAFMATSALAIAFLTVTYRQWARGRDAFAEDEARERRRRAHVLSAHEQVTKARQAADESRTLLLDADEALAGAKAQAAAAEVRRALEAQHELFARVAKLEADLGALASASEAEHKERSLTTLLQARWLEQKLATGGARLQASLAALRAAPASDATESTHCAACGQASKDSTFCPRCGKARPLRLHCAQCGDAHPFEVHVVSLRGQSAHLHCPRCGHRRERTIAELLALRAG